jgi:hypothetical protein
MKTQVKVLGCGHWKDMKQTLGKILQMDLRNVWPVEPDFTKWLAEEQSLRLLSDEIGVDIQLIQVEADVGDFNVDILAEEVGTGRKIVIENQLETTNHDHLGKLITYASGHDAKVVVWIFKDVREEHRQAIDWLNENTLEDVGFFAVKLELWQIEGSKPALKFDVICRPNEWAKAVKGARGATGELSDMKLKQLDFWTKLRAHATETRSVVKLQGPLPQHWTNIAVGSSEAHLALAANTRDGLLVCELNIPDNKDLFAYLATQKAEIEEKLGRCEWDGPEEHRKRTVIYQTLSSFDINDAGQFPKYLDWLLERAEAFGRTFRPMIKEYQSQERT